MEWNTDHSLCAQVVDVHVRCTYDLRAKCTVPSRTGSMWDDGGGLCHCAHIMPVGEEAHGEGRHVMEREDM